MTDAASWRRWALDIIGDTPAARAASDEDLRRAVGQRLADLRWLRDNLVEILTLAGLGEGSIPAQVAKLIEERNELRAQVGPDGVLRG